MVVKVKTIKYVLVLILLYFLVANMAIKIKANEVPYPQQNADFMIILGSQVIDNPAIPNLTLQERLDTALLYLQDNPNTRVIVCGGKGKDESATEASVMKQYLVKHGIDEIRIVEEDQSTRTAHQFINAQQIVAPQSLGRIVVVTSDFHLLRALMLADRAGLADVEGLSAPLSSDNSDRYLALLREPLALLNSFLFD